MRILEFVLALTPLLWIPVGGLGRIRIGYALVALLTVGLFLGHAIWEGLRLQAAPIYLGVVLAAVVNLAPLGTAWRLAGDASAIALGVIGALACHVYPVFQFERPAGKFAIGTATYYLTDESRKELFGVTPNGKRRYVAQIWYPANHCDHPSATYRDSKALTWRSAHMSLIRTNACPGAEPASGAEGFPLVLFSPSSGGYRSQNTYLVEHLVSHGYAVVGFDHPYTCSRVVFQDGTIVYSMPDVWINLESRKTLRESLPKTQAALDENVGDMRHFLDQFSAGKLDTKLSSRINFSRVGAIGHSFGGAAAAALCRRDSRVLAGANLDGWMFGDVVADGVPKPFLFVIEDDPLWFNNPGPFPDTFAGVVNEGTKNYHDSIRKSIQKWGGCVARLKQATHVSYADMALYLQNFPWQPQPVVGPRVGHRFTRELLLGFLDQNLNQQAGALARAADRIGESLDLSCQAAPRENGQ